jgi:hypothetical protein
MSAPQSGPQNNVPQTEDPAVTVRAKDALHRVQTGTVDRAQLTQELSSALSNDALSRASTALGALGEPQRYEFAGKAARGNLNVYVYHVTFNKGVKLDEVIAFDDTNKIARLFFTRTPGPGDASPAPAPTSS